MTTPSASQRESAWIECDVAAIGFARGTPSELKDWRRNPGEFGGEKLSYSLFKHADEQSVAGVVAVLRAIASFELDARGFDRWGVIAAPRFQGRSTFDVVWPRFLAEGAWGVSPHLAPQHTLHATSGLISQVLKAHGPNFGVDRARGAEIDGLMAASWALQTRKAPGVWAVMTSVDAATGHIEGFALALTLASEKHVGARLKIGPTRFAIQLDGEEIRIDPPELWSKLASTQLGSRTTARDLR